MSKSTMPKYMLKEINEWIEEFVDTMLNEDPIYDIQLNLEGIFKYFDYNPKDIKKEKLDVINKKLELVGRPLLDFSEYDAQEMTR